MADPVKDEVKTGSEDASKKKNGIREMLDRAMLSYERLPMLEIVFDRFVRTLSTSLRNLTSENVEIEIKSMTSLRYGDYMNKVETPSLLVVYKVIEWEDFGLVIVDSNLIYAILDVLFGGRRHKVAKMENRPYTKIENGIIRQVADIILNDLGISFDDLSPATFQFDRIENNPRFATISRAGDAAILLQLKVDMDNDTGGKIEVLLPYSTLEPIKPLLLQVYMGEKYGKDSSWEAQLESEIYQTIISMEAELGNRISTMQEIGKMKVGSTLMFDQAPEDNIIMKCGSIPMFGGKLGRLGNKVAVSISEMMNKKLREGM